MNDLTIIKCKKCKKEFNHFRHFFPKNYLFHCGWCGQEHAITEDCYSPNLKFKELKSK